MPKLEKYYILNIAYNIHIKEKLSKKMEKVISSIQNGQKYTRANFNIKKDINN